VINHADDIAEGIASASATNPREDRMPLHVTPIQVDISADEKTAHARIVRHGWLAELNLITAAIPPTDQCSW
jgi:hypothetical protein